ncbi:MAG: YlxR family protein [Candidatus Nanopelagicales bacterium]
MIRTCIGCRARQESDDSPPLAHVVAVGQVVTPDPRRALPGRGAWVHPDCVDEATRRRAWGRSLRLEGAVDLSLVLEPGALRV